MQLGSIVRCARGRAQSVLERGHFAHAQRRSVAHATVVAPVLAQIVGHGSS